jgi:hypothetical protein
MHDWNALVRARLNPLPVDPARAGDIADEMAQHVAQEYADLVASGVAEGEALERVLAPLADRARVAEEIARADRPRAAAALPPPSRFVGPADRPWAGRSLRRGCCGARPVSRRSRAVTLPSASARTHGDLQRPQCRAVSVRCRIRIPIASSPSASGGRPDRPATWAT